MTKLKIHYDGWVMLPATIRRRLGVTTGDQLIAEWTSAGLLVKSPHKEAVTEVELVVQKEEVVEIPPKKVRAAPSRPAPKKGEKTSRIGASTIPKTRGRRKVTAS